MNNVIKTNDLSFYNDYGTLTLSAKQYDTGRKFKFRIMNGDTPFDLTGYRSYIRIKKADATEFQGEGCCIIDGYNILVDTAIGNGEQILTADGLNYCELHLTDDNGGSLTTWNFIIDVQKRVHNGDNLNSIDSWDRLDHLQETVLKLNEEFIKHIEDNDNPHTIIYDDVSTLETLSSGERMSVVFSKIKLAITTLIEHIFNFNNPHNINKIQLGLELVENKSSEMIRGELTKDNVTNALQYTPYTPSEVDNKFSALENGLDWKESVSTYNDLLSVYPNPEKGWTVNTDSTTYRYNGSEWIDIGISSIPKATNNVDGLLAKEDHVKYEEAYSKVHQHNNLNDLNRVTSALIDSWNMAYEHSQESHSRADASKTEKSNINGNVKINNEEITVYTHPETSGNKHIPAGGSSGQVLICVGDGTVDWSDLYNPDIIVMGVKGDKETEYRTGNINLTPEDIGSVSENTFNSTIGDISSILDSINRVEI